MNFFIRQHSNLPVLKVQLFKDSRNNFREFANDLLEATITFSMVDEITGTYVIVDQPAYLEENVGYPGEYFIVYQFTKKQTKKTGGYIGQFKVKNNQGEIIVPVREILQINITDSFKIGDASASSSCCKVNGGFVPTPKPSETPNFTPTNTQTPTVTPTETPTQTPTQTPTNTLTPTQTPTNTLTPTQTLTNTPTNSATPSETPTQTPTPTPTSTHTPTPTLTPDALYITLEGGYSSGSINAYYVATLSRSINSDLEVLFVDTLGTITGDTIIISGSVVVNSGTTSGTTFYSIDENYNNLNDTSTFSNINVLFTGSSSFGYVVNTSSDFDVTPTPTPTLTQTNTPTVTESPTNTPTPTPTPTSTVTPSVTADVTPTQTPTSTVTPSVTSDITPTPTPTSTVTPSITASITPTASVTPSITSTVTPTVSVSNTPDVSATATPTQTVTPSTTPVSTSTPTPTNTVTPSTTPDITSTPTPTSTVTPSVTSDVTPTPTTTSTVTPSVTAEVTPTQTPTNTVTPSTTPDITSTPTPTSTVTPSVTAEVTPTQTPTSTVTPSVTAEVTPTQTPTSTVTPSVTATVTPTASVTPSITSTVTPTVSVSNTPDVSATATPTQTVTPSVTPDVTSTPTPTNTVTPSTTPDITSTPTPTSTVTPSVTASETPTQTPTSTVTPSVTAEVTPTQTPTNTLTPSVTASETPTQTPTNTVTPSVTASITPTQTPTSTVTPSVTAEVTPTSTPTSTPTPIVDCYVAGPLITDSSNGAVFDRSINVSGMLEVIAGAVGGQAAVPDEFSKKVARSFQLIMDPSATGITLSYQNNLVATLRGDVGTIHEGLPTAQRVGYGNGDDYDPNWLTDEGISGYTGYQQFLNTHTVNDMVWYQSGNTTGDTVITEVFEHIFHTVHLFGIMGAVPGSSTAVNWMAEENPDWQTTDLHLSMKQAIDNGMYDPSGYAPDWSGDTGQAQVAYKEYMYLLNFGMWEMSEFWDGGSLSPEWNDNMRTPSGIQTNNILGYNLFNSYFAPVLTKPSFVTLRNIFQDNGGGVSGYFADDCITPTPTPTQTPTNTPTNTVTPTVTTTNTNTPTTTKTPTPTSTPAVPVTTNLSLYYDPSNPSSYPGTGTVINDLSGNGLNGTMSNITYTSPYFTYNGTSSQIQVADNVLLEPGSGDWTMEVWVNQAVLGNDVVLGKFDNGGLAQDASYSIRTTNTTYYAQLGSGIGTGSTLFVDSTPYVGTINTWYQIVYVFTNVASNTLQTFVNGVSIGSVGHSLASVLNTVNPLYIGSYNGGEYPQWFDGKIGITRLYNKSLTASEVLQNFDADKSKYGL